MTDTLFPLLPADDAHAAAAESDISDVLANVNLFRVLLHNPGVARVMASVIKELTMGGSLDPRLKELAILRVGWRMGALYEWSNHYPIARRSGVTEDEILAVRQGPDDARLDPVAQVVLMVVDEILDHHIVSPTTLSAARLAFNDEPALLELLVIPGLYRTLATVLQTLEVPLEDGREAWPPDGATPVA
jgi:alkylhydroperoxidase family enzyme